MGAAKGCLELTIAVPWPNGSSNGPLYDLRVVCPNQPNERTNSAIVVFWQLLCPLVFSLRLCYLWWKQLPELYCRVYASFSALCSDQGEENGSVILPQSFREYLRGRGSKEQVLLGRSAHPEAKALFPGGNLTYQETMDYLVHAISVIGARDGVPSRRNRVLGNI